MARLIVLPAAQGDIDDIAEYLARNNLSAGVAFLQATARAFETLLEMPELGPSREDLTSPRLQGLRSFPVQGFENWLVFYRPTASGIEVLRVLHGARDLKTILSAEQP